MRSRATTAPSPARAARRCRGSRRPTSCRRRRRRRGTRGPRRAGPTTTPERRGAHSAAHQACASRRPRRCAARNASSCIEPNRGRRSDREPSQHTRHNARVCRAFRARASPSSADRRHCAACRPLPALPNRNATELIGTRVYLGAERCSAMYARPRVWSSLGRSPSSPLCVASVPGWQSSAVRCRVDEPRTPVVALTACRS